MAQIVLGPNKAYPSIPSVSGDLENHTLVLQALREAIEIHERRTRNTGDSFVRVSELEGLGILNVDEDTGIVEDDDDDGAFIKRDGTSAAATGRIDFGAGIDVAGGVTQVETLTASGAVTFSSTLAVTGALTAASYGGILEANLLDKSAAETVTGNWIFSGLLTIPELSVTAHEAAINHDNLLGFVANEHIDWTVDAGVQIAADNLAPDVLGETPAYPIVTYDRFPTGSGTDYDAILDSGTFGMASGHLNGPGLGTLNSLMVLRNSSDVRVQVEFPRLVSYPLAYRGYSSLTWGAWHYTGWTTTLADADLSLYPRKAEDATITGAWNFSRITTFDTHVFLPNGSRFAPGARAFELKAGTSANHVYMGFYANSYTQSTRSGWIGYGLLGTKNMTISNERSGGDIIISPSGAGNVRVHGTLYSQASNIYTASTSINYQGAAYLRSVKYYQTGVDAWTVAYQAAVTAGSWYTILTEPQALDITTAPFGKTGSGRAAARVRVWDIDTGQHSFCEFEVACNYGQRPTVTLLNRSGYGSGISGMRGIRVVRYSTYNGVAIQVQAGHTGKLFMAVQQLHNDGFYARNFISQTPNAAWAVEEIDFNNYGSDMRFAVLTGPATGADGTFDGIGVADGRFYPSLDSAGSENGWFAQLTGNYGSVNVAGSAGSSGTWAGYSIENEYVLTSYSGAGRVGIYNDVDNEWMQQWYRNAGIQFNYNGTVRMELLNGYLMMRDGWSYRAYDSTDADYIEMDHDGTQGVITTGSGDGEIQLKAGGVTRIETQWAEGTGNTTSLKVYHHTGSQYDVGLNVLPVFNDDTSDTLEERHCGAINIKDNPTALTLTLEASSGTNFPIYGVTRIVNNASGNYTISEGIGTTLYYIKPGVGLTDTAGGCTVGPGGVATIWRRSGSVYWIWGSEITP